MLGTLDMHGENTIWSTGPGHKLAYMAKHAAALARIMAFGTSDRE
jgi:hypothetical protein